MKIGRLVSKVDRNKWIPFIIMGLTAVLALFPAIVYPESGIYGQAPDLDKVTAVSAIFDDPAKFIGRTVKVEGLVVDVCSRRGCWMSIAGDRPFETLRIKVDDGAIVFPLTARGMRAAVQGEVQEIRMTREEAAEFARHQAQESGRSFDPASVKGPAVLYQIHATGAVIR